MPEETQRHTHFALFVEIFVFLLALVFIYEVRNIIAIFIAALIIASAVTVWSQVLRRRFNIPYRLGVIFIYVLLLGIISLMVYFLLPQVFEQLKNLPALTSKLAKGIKFSSPTLNSLKDFIDPLLSGLQSYVGAISTFIANAFGGIFSASVIFVISFYLSFEEKGVEKLLKLFFPKKIWGYVLYIWNTSQRKFAAWLFAQVILMTMVGVLVYISMLILGVPNAELIGLMAGILEIIPFFGPIITGILAVLMTLSVSIDLAFWAVIAFIIVQQLENHIGVPLVMNRTIRIHPVLVILAILIGGALGDVLGVLIAVPIMSVIIELIQNPPKGSEEENELVAVEA